MSANSAAAAKSKAAAERSAAADAAAQQASKRQGKEVRYWGERQRIVFVNLAGKSIEPLAGAGGAPIPKEGYGKWVGVPRPQRNAITVLEGFEATTVAVPVTFTAVKFVASIPNGFVRVGGATFVEEEIQTIEEMAGLLPYEPNKAFVPQTMLLSVYTADGKGEQIPLMPQGPVRHLEAAKTYWVISEIEWDTKPERNTAGYRIRQDATVTLMEWSPASGGRSAVSVLRAQADAQKPTRFTSTAAINTVARIAAHFHHPYPEAWQEILKANRGNPKIGTSAKKHLRPGTSVIIPALIAKSGIR